MKKIIYGALICVVVSFIVQAVSHFAINANHFASIGFMRTEPILWMGVSVMVIQGIALSYIYKGLSVNGLDWKSGLLYGLMIAVLLVGYIAVVEPSKYEVPSISLWVLVEGGAGIIQFGVFGALIGILFKNSSYAL
jgi:hypothetical protein